VHIAQDIGAITVPHNRRLHQRHETRWWGELAAGAQRLECYVYDVSLGGAKLLVFGTVVDARRGC